MPADETSPDDSPADSPSRLPADANLSKEPSFLASGTSKAQASMQDGAKAHFNPDDERHAKPRRGAVGIDQADQSDPKPPRSIWLEDGFFEDDHDAS